MARLGRVIYEMMEAAAAARLLALGSRIARRHSEAFPAWGQIPRPKSQVSFKFQIPNLKGAAVIGSIGEVSREREEPVLIRAPL